MKKVVVLTAVIAALITLSAVFFLGTYDFKSDGTNFNIAKLNIDATIYEDGSLEVENEYFYQFHDDWFTFAYQTINKKGLSSISDVTVSQGGIQFKYVEERNCYTANLNANEFCVEDEGNRYVIGWGIEGYDRGLNEYTITYTAHDAVQVFRDFALLDFQFVGDESSEPFNNINIDLHFPVDASRKDELYLFGHNSYGGNIKLIDGSHAQFNVPYNGPYTFVEVTSMFPSDVMNVSNVINKDILEDRLALEQSFQDKDKEVRRQKQFTGYMVYGGLAIVSILLLLGAMSHRKKYKQIIFDLPEYQREIDLSVSPAKAHAIYTLKNGKYKVSTAISATLLSLVYKKAIEMDFENDDVLYRNNHDDSIVLDETEALLFQFIFGIVTTEETITQKEFKKTVTKKGKQATEFYTQFDRVVQKSIRGFKDDMSQSMTVTLMIIGVLLQIAAALIYGIFGSYVLVLAPVMIIAISTIAILLLSSSRILTEKGEEQYLYWAAVRKFFTDFSRLDDYELPHYIMWEQYMVYAVALDVADDVIRQLKVTYPQISDASSSQPSILRMYMNVQLYRIFTRNMMGNVVTSSRSSYRQYQSTVSRGSGRGFSGGFGGGGFSGGGGFGGGGGGIGVR